MSEEPLHPDDMCDVPDPHVMCPQKALCGGIPGAVLEPLVRFWSHIVGIYRQNLTRSLEN